MPRYFFHVMDGVTYPDREGTDLLNLLEARREAVRYAGALLLKEAETFWATGEWNMRVTDENDLFLFELTFFASNSPATC
jgi:hypothetical protein